MERSQGCPQTQIIRFPRRGNRLRGGKKGIGPPYTSRGPQLSTVLAPYLGRPENHAARLVARKLVEICGALSVRQIGPIQVALLNGWLNRFENPFTRHVRAGAARRILRYLREEHGAANLAQSIITPPRPKPRNVTASAAEKAAILAAAPPNLKCFLLLCSDLAIRSGTAVRLTPQDYDVARGELSFRTKYQAVQTLPVTAALQPLLSACTDPTTPFVAQLDGGIYGRVTPGSKRMQTRLTAILRRVLKACGITKQLRPHDLRRTTARAVFDVTGDLLIVQKLLGHDDLASTAWYLQGHMKTTPLSVLELAKLPTQTQGVQ